jgi:protocatechuate 3,4-dioxygenase beta subunit
MKPRERFPRRTFIASAIALPALSRSSEGALPADASSSVARVVASAEPGERLVIAGTVFQADGLTKMAGASIELYHTDAAGWYAKPENDPRRARLHGFLTTDASGSYRIETVLPGHYANQANPPVRHIHLHLGTKDLAAHWIDSFHFADDPRLSASEKERGARLANFSSVLTLARENGVLTARRDIRIDPDLATRNRLAEGFYWK